MVASFVSKFKLQCIIHYGIARRYELFHSFPEATGQIVRQQVHHVIGMKTRDPHKQCQDVFKAVSSDLTMIGALWPSGMPVSKDPWKS